MMGATRERARWGKGATRTAPVALWCRRWIGTLAAALCAAAAGCDAPEEPKAYAALAPPVAAWPRLTREQYKAVVTDVFGDDLALPSQLEPDASIDGMFAVGAAIATVSNRGVELYEDGARGIARQIVEKPGRLGDLLPCGLGSRDACLQALVDRYAPRLWRRPASAEERTRVIAIGQKAGTALGTDADAMEYALAALLQSPHLLYRAEIGEPDPEAKGGLRLTAYELAGKLALVLGGGAPDAELVARAADGTLNDPKVLRLEAERLLKLPTARRAVRAFASQWLHLDGLDGLNKDPTIFKHFSTDLGAAAREETLRLVEWLVFEQDADMRDLITTRTTFVDRRLAAIYDVPAAVEDGFGQVTLPASGVRRGLLGHVSFLASRSHPVSSSATLRGVFIREVLLCEQVPLPPSDLNTSIPEASSTAPTLKERLIAHMLEPSCNGCHSYTDPPGFGLENFDGIGRYRSHDNGALIDPSGTIDGVNFKNAVELSAAIADNPNYRKCLVEKVWAFANNRRPGKGTHGTLERLEDRFGDEGMRLRALLLDVVTDPSFRRLAVAKAAP